ncbi:pirin family protein [uncultured Sphingomonas sp.]|uniref:pirin family protein n=1 Tax=uncultured Sphingomonas sp. TaxID=158754 RepID=UPI0035C9D50D
MLSLPYCRFDAGPASFGVFRMPIPVNLATDGTSHRLMAWQLTAQPAQLGLTAVTAVPGDRIGSVGPFVMIARFQMTDRPFPPHPHAGFTAMTYVVRSSSASMYNRDSLGDRSLIRPGGAHWTIANSGMVHDETPERAGDAVDAFQIFINHPAAAKLVAAASAHRDPSEIPPLTIAPGVALRLVMGEWDGRRADVGLPVDAMMADLELQAGASFSWSRSTGQEAMLYVEQGIVVVDASGDRAEARAGDVISIKAALEDVTISAGDAGATLFAFAGTPLADPVAFGGPFITNGKAEVESAFGRFRSGAMGSLAERDDADAGDRPRGTSASAGV